MIEAGRAAPEIYDNIAAKIKAKSNEGSCSLTYGTQYDNTNFEGYAYKTTTSNGNFDTTAQVKTIRDAVHECADGLHDVGVVDGCCLFGHGGSWQGHLRIIADPVNHPAEEVNC